MDACTHHHLVLLPKPGNRLRCRHCHLTIKSDELSERYCPECFETSGKRRYDFEDVVDTTVNVTQYRCEDCGVIIDCA